VEITYGCKDISWEVYYVATLDNDETRMQLNGWFSINNQTQKTFQSAEVILVSSDNEQTSWSTERYGSYSKGSIMKKMKNNKSTPKKKKSIEPTILSSI